MVFYVKSKLTLFVLPVIFLLLFGCIGGLFGPDWDKVSAVKVEALNDAGTDFEGNVIIYMRFEGDEDPTNYPSATLPVEVYIYTSKYAEDGLTRIPDRLLYSGEYTITNLEKAGYLTANEDHILIPRDELGPIYEDDLNYGIATVVAHLPNGVDLEDNAYSVKLK